MSSIQKSPNVSAVFLSSAAHFREIPESTSKEFCIMGRSNVGKSSFINHVFRNGKLARVSKTPGKTTLANFFKISDGTIWADLPGYGFAQKARSDQERWSMLVADYCEKRENLCGVIWLVDSRHPGLPIDRDAFTWLTSLSLPVFPVLTKADKLSHREQAESIARFRKDFPGALAPALYSTRQEDARIRFWESFPSWATELLGS
jgi:GTP-binding protein